MRRPRGPGGRFLTAEEIAAQKTAQGEGLEPVQLPLHEDGDEHDEDVLPPVALKRDQPHDSYQDPGSLTHALAHSPRQSASHPQSQQVQFTNESATHAANITMHSTYPTMAQMQPTAGMHYANGLYHHPNAVGVSSESEMRRRTEEMIHFGGTATGSGGA